MKYKTAVMIVVAVAVVLTGWSAYTTIPKYNVIEIDQPQMRAMAGLVKNKCVFENVHWALFVAPGQAEYCKSLHWFRYSDTFTLTQMMELKRQRIATEMHRMAEVH